MPLMDQQIPLPSKVTLAMASKVVGFSDRQSLSLEDLVCPAEYSVLDHQIANLSFRRL